MPGTLARESLRGIYDSREAALQLNGRFASVVVPRRDSQATLRFAHPTFNHTLNRSARQNPLAISLASVDRAALFCFTRRLHAQKNHRC
jgi:hypothetical protein